MLLATNWEHLFSFGCWLSAIGASNIYYVNVLSTCLFILIGVCYQFNSDGRHNTDMAGARSGLLLVFNADVDSYFIGPSAGSSGFDVSGNIKLTFFTILYY